MKPAVHVENRENADGSTTCTLETPGGVRISYDDMNLDCSVAVQVCLWWVCV